MTITSPAEYGNDYPTNLGLSRKLESAERLILRGDIAEASAEAQLEVAFWSDAGIVSKGITPTAGESFEVDQSSALRSLKQPVAPESVPLTAETPIGIRVSRGSVTIKRLSIHRHIEYQLRRLDDRSIYPIRLTEGQYFVLGDNVPVSIDSRDEGPIDFTDIIGVVRARSNSTPGQRANPSSTRTNE